MSHLRAVSLVVACFAVVLTLQTVGDARGWTLPWYFLHEIAILAPLTAFLLGQEWRHLRSGQQVALLATLGGFEALSAIMEIVAIHHRFWWFPEVTDRFVGAAIGGIPVEEFLYYPLILAIPPLSYRYWARALPDARGRSDRWVAPVVALGVGFLLAGVGLLAMMPFQEGVLDPQVLPVRDAQGAFRYATGPAMRGWSVVQLLSMALVCGLVVALRRHLHARALLAQLATFFPLCVYLELMAIGRGWWTWNSQQVLGPFTWVLPLDSYLMYLTGSLMPVLVFVGLEGVFDPSSVAGDADPTIRSHSATKLASPPSLSAVDLASSRVRATT